jgi:xylose isomerase
MILKKNLKTRNDINSTAISAAERSIRLGAFNYTLYGGKESISALINNTTNTRILVMN